MIILSFLQNLTAASHHKTQPYRSSCFLELKLYLYMLFLYKISYSYQVLIILIDMSQKQSKPAKKELLWQSQNSSYEQSISAIKLAQQSYIKETPIPLESSLNDRESMTMRKSMWIAEMARNSEPLNQSSESQSTNIANFILSDIQVEDEKYGLFENPLEHSSEEQAEVEATNDEIEDIVASVKKDPQIGKITFISKLINSKKANIEFRVLRLRGVGNLIPQIHQSRNLSHFTLYEIEINSFLKKMAVELILDGKIIAKSREISFSPRQILLDLQLSYNIDKQQDIRINFLEGLLTSCLLEGDQLVEEILQLSGKRELKTKILNERYTVDDEVKRLIKESKNMASILKLLKLLLQQEKWQLGVPSDFVSNPAYTSLAQIFIGEMLKFKPTIGRDERQETTAAQSIKLVQLYIHFVCLAELKTKGISISSFEKEAQEKLSQFINFVFQVSEMRIYHRFIQFCIMRQLPILPQSYDTIKDYVSDYNLNSSECILTHLEIIYYNINIKRANGSIVKLFVDGFQNKKFESNNIYEKEISDILKLSSALFKQMDIDSLNFEQFANFFQTYWNFRQNTHLIGIIRQPVLRQKIQNYITAFQEKYQRASEKEKSFGITVIELYFITLKDDELINEEETFKKLVQYLIDRTEQRNFEPVVKLYFQIFKRGTRSFSLDFIRNLSNNLSRKLQLTTADKALMLLSKYFNDDYLESEELITICNENLLKPNIWRLIPDNIRFLEDVRTQHFKWHNNFKYFNHFNEQILERMTRMIQKYFNDNITKEQYLNQIKRQIQREVEDEEKRISLIAIIDYDMLDLGVESLWGYFTEKRGYLKILIKILKREESSSEILRESLMEIHHQIESKNVDFYKIQRVKSMKPNQWHNFVQLTDENGIPKLINRIFEEGNTYLSNLKKLQNFVREIGAKFSSPNYQDLCGNLQDLNKIYVKESIRQTNIQQQLPVFRGFRYEVLTCYKLKPFFGNKNFTNRSIEQIVQDCGQLLLNLQSKVKQLYKSYENKTIKSDNFYYFQPKKDDIKEFRNIILMYNKQEVSQYFDDIVSIYNIISDAEQNFRLLNSFNVVQRQKFNLQSSQIIRLARICEQLANKSTCSVLDIQQKLNDAYSKLKEFKLNFRDHRQFFEVLDCLTQNSQKIPFFNTIQNTLKDIKDEINESGGDVEYEEIEECEITIQFLKEVYNIQTTFSQFILAYFAFIEKKKRTTKDFALNQTLKTAFSIIPQLKEIKANMEDSNRSAVKFIDQVIKKVRFEVKNDPNNKDKVITTTTLYPNGEAKLVDERQIYINKQKAIMISCTIKEGQKSQRKKEINNFLEIIKVFQQLKEQQIKLTQWGSSQFKRQSLNTEISNCQLNSARQIIISQEKQLVQWKKDIKKLYQINFKAAHLQGRKFKQFYDFITLPSQDQIPNHFLVIIDNLDVHRSIVKQLKESLSSIRNRQLALISNYFQLLKVNVNSKQEDAPDRDENFLHFIKIPKGQVDFIKGIHQIGSARIQGLKFQQILICTPQTSKSEIKSFIERALRDINSQYIILSFQSLDRRKQQFIVDQIKNFKAQYGSENFKLKLCLIGDSELELLYKFSVQELNKSPEKTQNISTIAKAYEGKLKQECNRIKIVYSCAAGLGKSSFIKKDSFNIYQCTEQYYLPLSGIMAVPAESIDDNNNSIITNQTEKFLWDRFEQAMIFFTEAQKLKKKACLVIQIYNIEPSVADIINKFLQNVLFFKSHKYRNNNGKLLKDIPIYVQLENVSLPAYNQLSKKFQHLPPQMRMLPFLREIYSVCGQKIIENIENFLPEHIKISKQDKELNYILNHLKLFKTGQINNISILPYKQYHIQPIEQEQGLRLIKQFFFDSFKITDRPSGYLWTYFRSLLFQASKNFSTSYFLKIATILETDKDIQAANKQLHNKMKLRQTFRSEFYKIIHKNCLEFIQRSVKPGEENADTMFNETLKNLPFLIIPNIDGDSFSFIYNNSEKVPDVIKAIIVLQTPTLVNKIANISIEKLFQEENLASFERNPNSRQWVERSSQILANISGNRHYKIDCEKGYIVNIDNFFKMCLIVQRIRLNIPIVIMGEAGIGKTALLRHVVKHLFQHQFAVFNINAGLPLQSKKTVEQQKTSESLASIVNNIQRLYQQIQAKNALLQASEKKKARKLWVFFDEFNTLRELGFFKEIIIDGRYLGKEQPHIKNVVMMAACNPHKKLQLNEAQRQELFVNVQAQKLAFDVLPAPHSLIECMWNYGSLTPYEYEKYISKMLIDIRFQSERITPIILKLHQIVTQSTYQSAVSLRDIDRFRQLYCWFNANLPRQLRAAIPPKLGPYNNIEERAFILSCYFTYILRFSHFIRNKLQQKIEQICDFSKGYILAAKETQQDDLCARLNFNWDAPIALNGSLKENIYSCFVCINTRLPLLIIGAPGCSKSLSLRILAKNLKDKTTDQYLSKFKRIRQYLLQGSQNTTAQGIKIVFEKAYKDLLSKDKQQLRTRKQMKQISVVVFDEIGLAQKSKDNPLKVLHPYLQVSREENLQERMLSFIGISNSELDVSKMSRLLVLRRPPAQINDLIFTAKGIAAGYRHGNEQKIKYIIETLARIYTKFIQEWKKKGNNYPLFFGLRDFYGLIKVFMTKMIEKQIQIENDEAIVQCAGESIFENFHGWQGTYKTFKEAFYDLINFHQPVPHPTMKETLQSVLKTLDKESFRYPLVIVEDHESLCFVKWMIEKRYQHKFAYMEGSPFVEEKEYSLKLLGQICKNMDHQFVLTLSNLSEGVKTGLYDFFNKSFTVRASNNNKYLKMRTQEGSLNQIQYLYHEKFNCVYLLLEAHLQKAQPPFLSRFQKYRFSLRQYRQELSVNILSKVQKFFQRVEQICRNNNMCHFKFKNLFININKPALESMCVAAYETAGQEGAYRQALRRLIMNSGQYFFKIYKHFIEPNGDLPEIKQMMNEAIESKNNSTGDRNLIIRFTNDKQYTKKFNDQLVSSVEFVTFKKEADFDEQLSKFFKSASKKTLYITLHVHNENIYLNYVTSQIQKARRRALVQSENIEQKKIRLLYIFDKEKEASIDLDTAVTHFTSYNQEFDDGRLEEMKNITKKELFNSVITMDSLFTYVHQAFDFKFQGIQNTMKAQTTFERLAQALYKKKDGILCKQAEDVTLVLEPNIQMSEESIKEMIMDPQVTTKYRNYREALTKYFADRKLLGALAAFLRYLFEKESFMSFSVEQLFQYYKYVEQCFFDSELQKMIIEEKSKPSSNYNQLIKQIIESKKQYIASQYRTMKQTKRLPSASKKFEVKITKPRILPFSKAQCETILNYGEKQIAWYVKQIYVYDEKQEKDKFQSAMKTYEDQFKKKTKFNINNQKNLYATRINEDKNLKTMLLLDLLSDFCEQKGLPFKYLGKYYRIISQFFATGEAKYNKGDRTLTFYKMVAILIGYEDIWVQIFKVCQTLAEDGQEFILQGQIRVANREGIRKYVENLYKYLQKLLLGANILTNFKNPEKYTSTYINTLFHLQKLEQLANLSIPNKLKSTRTTLVFIQMFDVVNKSRYIEQFMKFSSKIQISSHYHETYNYFQGLKTSASKEQSDKITQFEANQLFYEWFKQQPRNPECLRLFLINCENQVFIHNSVATINLFITTSAYNKYNNIQEAFEKLNQCSQEDISVLLAALGQSAKESNYKNNLAIMITNIFIQKLSIIFKDQSLIVDDKKFKSILDKVINAEVSGIGTLFAYAYFKIYLKEYVIRLLKNEKSYALSLVDDILRLDNSVCMNLKFYCLKLMRTLQPIKQIKEQFIKKKKVHWIAALQDIFQEEQSRSILVPNEKNISVSPSLIESINIAVASHGGEFKIIDKIIDQANTPYNRYALFNFFMKYYFSMSYNEKLHKNGIKQKLLASRDKYTEKIGKLQFQLILRYAQSRFDENLKVQNAAEFKQDIFTYFNSFNWLLASRSATSPFHSLFLNKGVFHADFKAAFESQFFPCGPENSFIKIAQNVYALTRNNNVGVYVCSAQCDYIYSIEDCGWPREQSTCPICNKPIGCKPGQNHTVNRQQQGARRIQSPLMKDKGGKFYVYHMGALGNYWQMQRNYIQAEISRMKLASVITLGQHKVKLTGYNLQDSQRVSTLSYYFFRQNLNSIFYCLLSLGVISEDQSTAIFQGKNVATAKAFLLERTKSDIENMKNALNLNNKFFGWIFGMHKNMYTRLIDFQTQFLRYIGNIKQNSQMLAKRLEQQINEKKVASDYFQIYKDMATALRKGLLTKELDVTHDMTAKNRFTRDFLQYKIQQFIKTYTTMEKFTFAQQNASLQGKMQFPRDALLTEDQIDQVKFPFSRMLKIPDKEIKYNEIIINYELNIRQNYPFLDYILKNSDSLNSMLDFYNVLTFSNELAKEVEFNYERKDSAKPLRQFIQELWEKKEERVHQILRHPELITASWNKLANRMGVLQNDCTVVGKMNNLYSVETPIQAFLLDNSTKQNLYGLTLSSLFHNFAKMHNQFIVLLNARKNQIPQYKCLNLYNESKKIHPQKLQESDVFMISQKELQENLYKNSISSINYGKNFIFNNFDTYQQYFLMKLLGKCEIISDIKKFKSICYNGEAFAQTSDSSNTLTQVRDYFYEELTKQQVHQLQGFIRSRGNKQKIQEYIVKLRGDLQKTMIAIRNLNGIIESKCIGDFIEKLQFDDATYELKFQTFGRHSVSKIVHLYELLQFQLKPVVIQKLPTRYKEIMDQQIQIEITRLLQELPLEDEYRVTLTEFGYALYRFIARILQGGVQQNDKMLMQFLPYRNDFWPKDFEDYKLEPLMNNQVMSKLPFAYAGHLFEIVEKIIKTKVSASRI